MKTIHATWELENIGLDAYEIFLEPIDTLADYAVEEQRLLEMGAQYLVVKSPVNSSELLFGLPHLGYTFVEMVFQVVIRKDEYHMPEGIARFDRGLTVVERTDEENFERISRLIRSGVFVSDRVSIDPAFTLEQSGNRYANWLHTMLSQGAWLYEVLQSDRPIGFFVIKRVDEQTVNPVLMGMYDEQHDRGLGALLHKKTLDTCFTHDCTRMQSTVVSNNAKVLRVYVNAGATLAETFYTYVKHPGASKGALL